MPRKPLDGARAKLRRAAEHRAAFEEGMARYLDTGPVQVRSETLSEGDLTRIIWTASAASEPPDHLGLVVGDWAQNTRAALDYVVYELVRAELGAADPRWTQFPIVTVEEAYAQREAGQLRGAPSWALPVFRGLQPFNDGEHASFHPLAILADISNRDKHRLIHTAAMQIAGSQARMSGTGLMEIHGIGQNPGTVIGERVILEALVKVEGNDYEIGMDIQVAVALEGYEIPAGALLQGIGDEVEAIVEWFSPALDGPAV